MSLILDALRKMEQERRSRRGPAVDLRPEVLRYHADVKPRQGISLTVAAAAGLVVAAGIGAGVFLKGWHVSSSAKPAATPAASAPVAVQAAMPAPAAAQLAPAAGSVAQPAPAALQPPAAVPGPAPAVALPAPVDVARPGSDSHPAVAAPSAATGRKRQKGGGQVQAEAQPSEAALELQGGIPEITISGIAWQEERRMRRAVLNGSLVGEGAEVAGARVVEIKENRVRLSRGGQIFDVVLSSGMSR